MNIEKSTVERLMAKKVLEGHKVRPHFIEMGGIGMTESMCSDRMKAFDAFEVILDIAASSFFGNMGVRFRAWKEPSSRFAMGFPVVCEYLQGVFGEYGIPIGSVLGTADENPEVLTLNVFIAQGARLADTETC